MAESSDFNLILTDFLKYVPEPKRHDYELMLRRCNFSDPADPMFPVMLFLLFFQDNLADRMEELTEEVTRRKNESPAAQIPVVVPERKSGWKIGIAVLLAVQLLLIVFGVFCLITRELPSQIKSDSAISHSSEIRRINRYWDEKLQYARKGDFCMNRLDLIPESESAGVPGLIFLLFFGLTACLIIWLVLTIRSLRNCEKRLEEASGRLHRNLTQQKRTEELMAFLNSPMPPVPPNTQLPAVPSPESAPPPVADDTAWNEKDTKVEPVPESPAQD